MSVTSFLLMIGGLLIVAVIFLIIRKAFKIAGAVICFLVFLGFVYNMLPTYWQTSLRLTVALSTNGIFSKLNEEQTKSLQDTTVVVDNTGRFTWVKPVTQKVSNAPVVTNDNAYEFNMDFFTYDTKVIGYEVKCTFVEESKVNERLKALNIY